MSVEMKLDKRTRIRREAIKARIVPDILGESWLPINDYENSYSISNLGRVKSMYREVATTHGRIHRFPERIISHQIDPFGYHRVPLRKNLKAKYLSVHRLVATHFIENNGNLSQVNHKNGNKSDNVVFNLEWCTASENMKHAYEELDHARMRGERNGMTKLTPELIVSIKKSYSELKSFTKTGLQFGISGTHVWRIVRNKSWEHLYEN